MSIPGLSRRAYARARNVSLSAVCKAIAAGRIKPLASGLIDPRQADRDWHKWSRAALRTAHLSEVNTAGNGDYIMSADVEELLAQLDAERATGDDRVFRALEALRSEIAALRKDLRAGEQVRYPPGLDELRRMVAGLRIDLGVHLHQISRLVKGEPLTVSKDAFNPR
jgi:hypothetical protein